jgi:DNA-directed RNA polymerase subunit RPC12/RpoP
MSIKVARQCGKRFTAPPQFAGKSATCPSCGSAIAIAAPPAPPPARPATPKPAPSRVAGTDNAVAGFVVSCLCGQQFNAPTHLAGQQVPCPYCQQPISILAGGASTAAVDNLWTDLPQQQTWAAPQPQWGPQQPWPSPQQPWPPQQPYAPPGWAAPVQDASPHAALAHQYLANAHQETVERRLGSDRRGDGQIYSGIITMAIAALWFLGGLLVGVIFFFPPIMFIGGMVALINGIAQKSSR